jgi:hypothetical protein
MEEKMACCYMLDHWRFPALEHIFYVVSLMKRRSNSSVEFFAVKGLSISKYVYDRNLVCSVPVLLRIGNRSKCRRRKDVYIQQ